MTSYLLVVFLLTPALKFDFEAVKIAQYSTYEACQAAGVRATAYGTNFTCVPIVKDGIIELSR